MVAVSMMAVEWQLSNRRTQKHQLIQNPSKLSVFHKMAEIEVGTRSYKLLLNLGVGMCFPAASKLQNIHGALQTKTQSR